MQIGNVTYEWYIFLEFYFILSFFFFFFIVLSRLEYTRRNMRLVHDAKLNVPEVLFTMVF